MGVFKRFCDGGCQAVPCFVPAQLFCADSIAPFYDALFEVFYLICHIPIRPDLYAQCFFAGSNR